MFTVKFNQEDTILESGSEVEIFTERNYPIKYVLNGIEIPSEEYGEVYSNPLILEDGIHTIKAGVFSESLGGEHISEIFEKTYVVGDMVNVTKQTNLSNISVDNANCYNAPANCNLGDGFDGIINPLSDKLNFADTQVSSTITVDFDEPIIADTLLIPINIANTAFNEGASNSDGILSSDVTAQFEICYKDDSGNIISATDGGRKFVIKKGEKVYCEPHSNNTK